MANMTREHGPSIRPVFTGGQKMPVYTHEHGPRARESKLTPVLDTRWLAVWRSGSALVLINEVNVRRARLVLGWVTVSGFGCWRRHFFRYVISHPGLLTFLPSVGW